MPDTNLFSGLSVCLAILFIFAIDGDGVVAEEQTVAFEISFGSNATIATKFSHFNNCRSDYVDMTWEKQLRFFSSDAAVIPSWGGRIGNGRQLQCQNSTYCTIWAPESATCTRRNSSRMWDCNATLYNGDLELSNVHFECAKQDELHNYCVYKDSCVLFHSLRIRGSNIGKSIGFICLGLAIISGIIGLYIYIRHQNKSVSSTTIIQGAATATYVAPPNPPTVTNTSYLHPSQPPYPPAYQPPYQGVAAMPATLQTTPPSSQQAAPVVQLAFNPAYIVERENPAPYDPPPSYSSVTAGYRDK